MNERKDIMTKTLMLTVLVCIVTAFCFAEVSVNGPLTLEQSAKSGDIYKGDIILLNTDNTQQEVKVFLADYQFFADDRVLYNDPGSVSRSNAPWITYSPKRFIIPPKSSLNVAYSVKVPGDKSLVGTYWSCIMIEGIPSESPESGKVDRKAPSITVAQVVRYAIQVMTHIGDAGKRNLKFSSSKLVLEHEKKVLSIDVENTGDYMLRAILSVELYDEKGILAGKFPGDSFRLYPGTSKRFKTDLSAASNKKYKALVIVDCGGKNVFGVNMSLAL